MNEKNTKKNLTMSAISMLLCVVMLVGLTFAWFTDSVTNKGNRIQAGNLKIDLLMDQSFTKTYCTAFSAAERSFNIFRATAQRIRWYFPQTSRKASSLPCLICRNSSLSSGSCVKSSVIVSAKTVSARNGSKHWHCTSERQTIFCKDNINFKFARSVFEKQETGQRLFPQKRHRLSRKKHYPCGIILSAQ